MNQCDFDVFIWSVANVPNNSQTVAPNNFWSEPYRLNPNGGGISLKVATQSIDTTIVQLQYTYHVDDPNIPYDISNLNGYPFMEWGFNLFPSIPSCPTVLCDPGVPLCANGFNNPKSCDVAGNLVLFLCPPQTFSPTPTPTPTPTTLATIPSILSLIKRTSTNLISSSTIMSDS
jgi:hypothetical protein